MRVRNFVVSILGLSIALAAAPANAQTCPTVNTQPVFCSGTNGCTGSATRYFCTGPYTTNQNTCACSSTVKCCGNTVGPGLMSCGTLCAGCQTDEKPSPEMAEVRKTGESNRREVGPTKATVAAVQPKVIPVSAGPGGGGDR